jgi:signal peptidase I
VIFLIVRAAVQNFQVEGSSMDPTLHDGLYLLVNKAVYFEINLETLDKFLPFIDPGDDPTRYVFRGPQRGDVIVFVAPEQQPGEAERDFIKRIIAVPGETVEVRDGIVYINGGPLDEPYIEDHGGQNFGPQTVPEGHYFVLGDNRGASFDSRSFGMLPKRNIIGLAWVTYWEECGARFNWCPDFGLVDNTSVEPGEPTGAVPTPQATATPTPFATGDPFP